MKLSKLAIAIGYIDDDLVSKSIEYKPGQTKRNWMQNVLAAACVIFGGIIAFRFMIGFIGNQSVDIYRRGKLLEVADIEDISGIYSGKLLAENLDLTSADRKSIELYYDDDGVAENITDWYSLIISADYSDGNVVMYCLFDTTKSLEEWIVHTVFTPEKTQTIEINGVKILVANYDVMLNDRFIYYAIFEYQNVIYDIRVQDKDADSIFGVLNDILLDI